MDGQRRIAQPMSRLTPRAERGRWYDRALRAANSRRMAMLVRSSAVAFLGLTLAYGIVTGGHLEYEGSQWTRMPGKLSGMAGLAADDIVITGLVHQEPETVLAMLGIKPGSSLVGFDSNAAKRTLEGLDWVASADLHRLFPNRLEISITERVPFAIWQRAGQYYVIDHTGSAMSNLRPEDLPHLPLVTGEGAQAAVEELVNHMEASPDLLLKVGAAARVGQRRWNLYLDNGVIVMLPDGDVGAALQKLVKLEQEQHLLSKGIQAIDLRFPDRVIVRIAEVPQAEDVKSKIKVSQIN